MAIRIGTWNLENLFKPPNPFAPKTEQEYQAKLDELASAITRMDPHVLAVQEVGDPVAVGELADRVGGTWHIETAAPETGTAHTIRVGVLSRLPLTTFDPVAAFPDKLRAIQQGDKPTDNTTAMGRPALHVRVRIQDTDIDLITAHFKSKLLTFPPNRFSPTTRANAPDSVPMRSIDTPATGNCGPTPRWRTISTASIPARLGRRKARLCSHVRLDRFAVVTDVEWMSRTTKFMAMFMPMEGRVYPIADAAKAREWISET